MDRRRGGRRSPGLFSLVHHQEDTRSQKGFQLMKILIILGHPSAGSFNHAIARRAESTLLRSGHEVIFHDLYEEGFDPVMPGGEIPRDSEIDPMISLHCTQIASVNGIIIVHPNWWGQPPAILTGWIDRVLRPGVAYGFRENDSGEGIPEGLLIAVTALVLNTSNTFPEREASVFGDPLETIW